MRTYHCGARAANDKVTYLLPPFTPGGNLYDRKEEAIILKEWRHASYVILFINRFVINCDLAVQSWITHNPLHISPGFSCPIDLDWFNLIVLKVKEGVQLKTFWNLRKLPKSVDLTFRQISSSGNLQVLNFRWREGSDEFKNFSQILQSV